MVSFQTCEAEENNEMNRWKIRYTKGYKLRARDDKTKVCNVKTHSGVVEYI